MADNEDELVDYDEEEVRQRPPTAMTLTAANPASFGMDPLASKIQWYCSSRRNHP